MTMSIFGPLKVSQVVSEERNVHPELEKIRKAFLNCFVEVTNFQWYTTGRCSQINHVRSHTNHGRTFDDFYFSLQDPTVFEKSGNLFIDVGKLFETNTEVVKVESQNIPRYVHITDPTDTKYKYMEEEYAVQNYSESMCPQNDTNECSADPVDLECFQEGEKLLKHKTSGYCFRPETLSKSGFANPLTREKLNQRDRQNVTSLISRTAPSSAA